MFAALSKIIFILLCAALWLCTPIYTAALDEAPTISPEFALSEAVPGPSLDNKLEPRAAFDGENHLLVWSDWRSGSLIYGNRLSPAGRTLDAADFLISQSAAGYTRLSPDVAFDRTNYLVVWMEERTASKSIPEYDIYGARVTPAGQVLDPQEIAINTADGDQQYPKVAFDGQNYLVVWADARDDATAGIYMARISPAGALLDPNGVLIGSTGSYDSAPHVAFGDDNYLVTWQHSRYPDSGDEILGALVSTAGAVLSPAPLQIAVGSSERYAGDVSFDGANFLCTWRGYSQIIGARVTPTGTLLDPDGIVIEYDRRVYSTPRVAFGGGNNLVLWREIRNGIAGLWAARISPAGVVLDPLGIELESDGEPGSVVFDGTDFMLLWQRYLEEYPRKQIYGGRIDAAGEMLDPGGFIISCFTSRQYDPALAFNGTDYFSTWIDMRNGAHDIYGGRISASGELLDPTGILISDYIYITSAPTMVALDDDFLVVWQALSPGEEGYQYDIHGARVSGAGVLLDPDELKIVTSSYSQYDPNVASNGQDYLVTWWEYHGSEDCQVRYTLVDPDGSVQNTEGFQLSQAEICYDHAAAASDGENFLIFYRQDLNNDLFIKGAIVNSDGEVLKQRLLTLNGEEADDPAVAFDGENFLLVWQEDYPNGEPKQIWAERVTRDLTVLDHEGILIASDPTSESAPAVVFDGENFLVTWTAGDVGDQYGTVITPEGGLPYPQGFVISNDAVLSEDSPTLATAGNGTSLAAYHRAGEWNEVNERIYARFVGEEIIPDDDDDDDSDDDDAADDDDDADDDADDDDDTSNVDGGVSACCG